MEKLHHLEFEYQEKKLLRSIVSEIEALEQAYPGTVPHGIMKRYNELKELYAAQQGERQ